jgi:hypothetical protein
LNTPAHLVVSVAVFGSGAGRSYTRWIASGAMLPDLPMFGFYAWERLVRGSSERVIWGQAYFDPAWQDLFDLFNSIPLAAAGLGLALALRRAGPAWLAGAALLHQLMDLPLHREDAHRHLLPLSDWRFTSPVSYWDPAHYGAWVALGEVALVAGSCWVLWYRYPQRGLRVALASLTALYLVGWLALYQNAV